MADAAQAFLEFIIDIFSALTTFLGGGTFDFSTLINSLLGGDDTEEAEGESESAEATGD